MKNKKIGQILKSEKYVYLNFFLLYILSTFGLALEETDPGSAGSKQLTARIRIISVK
jgi:hypothetical protein